MHESKKKSLGRATPSRVGMRRELHGMKVPLRVPAGPGSSDLPKPGNLVARNAVHRSSRSEYAKVRRPNPIRSELSS